MIPSKSSSLQCSIIAWNLFHLYWYKVNMNRQTPPSCNRSTKSQNSLLPLNLMPLFLWAIWVVPPLWNHTLWMNQYPNGQMRCPFQWQTRTPLGGSTPAWTLLAKKGRWQWHRPTQKSTMVKDSPVTMTSFLTHLIINYSPTWDFSLSLSSIWIRMCHCLSCSTCFCFT